jgi:ABC-type glycerol-3-phosphate transport system permease component
MQAATKRARVRWSRVVQYGLLLLALVVLLFPFYWLACSAFKPRSEYLQFPPKLFPSTLTFQNIVMVWNETNFVQSFTNSAMVAGSTIVITVLISAFGAYAISRFRFRGRSVLARSVLLTYMIPQVLLLVPLFVLLVRFGLNNTRLGLIIVHVLFAMPFCLWLLIAFFNTIPVEIEEAALVDGCHRLGVLFRIIFPLSGPGIATAVIFVFLASWNEYLFASVFISSGSKRTLIAELYNFVTFEEFRWDAVMTFGFMIALPIFLLVLLFQNLIVKGLTAGATKG